MSHNGPAHQNSYAFRHNPRSRKTEQIKRIPNHSLCQRCHDIIEWRKRYRKYKPLTEPAKCAQCKLPRVHFAYHTLCPHCATQRGVCPKCCKPETLLPAAESVLSDERILELVSAAAIGERYRKTVSRRIAAMPHIERTSDAVNAIIAEYFDSGAAAGGATSSADRGRRRGVDQIGGAAAVEDNDASSDSDDDAAAAD